MNPGRFAAAFCSVPTEGFQPTLRKPAHSQTAIGSSQSSDEYLGRYLKRPPMAMSRLKHYDGSTVIFESLNHNTGKQNPDEAEYRGIY